VNAGRVSVLPALSADSRRAALTLGVLLLVCFTAISRDLWTPDEPREAEISREMSLSLTMIPTLNGRPFIEKPPLYYWTVAGVFTLLGEPSATAARSVSAVAAFLTLLAVYLWGRREFGVTAALAACIGLASSVQFMISTHWVLIDPLLMLFTTLAAWAGWELIRNGRRGRAAVAFYAALTLALWTKGLVGPVLIGSGLLVFSLWQRSVEPLRRLYPFAGIAVFIAATGFLAALIYRDGGFSAVREWWWVNHVERFINPEYTGHEQPFYYYLSAIPIAVAPWWVPFIDGFRPSRWRGAAAGVAPLKRYLASMFIGMALFLSASATKRGIYLLPMLPLVFLLLGARAAEWWAALPAGPIKSKAWWTQVGLVLAFAGGLPILGLAYLRTADAFAIVFLAALAAMAAALILYSRRGRFKQAIIALAACSLACPVALFGVVAHLAKDQKDMTPYVGWVGQQLPQGGPVFATGHIDETLQAIVPFVTQRDLVAVTAEQIAAMQPEYVLVQDGNGGGTAPELPSGYTLLRERSFGPERYLALWHLRHGTGQ
jgi:4-amino-4-deoxy-L-arabinose transferase-like glycosyltransferase